MLSPCPGLFLFHFSLHLCLSPIFLNLFMIQKPTSNQPELPLHAEGLKKIKMQPHQLEILTPGASENLCHRNAAQLCDLVPLKKNKFALKKIHQHIAYIYS